MIMIQARFIFVCTLEAVPLCFHLLHKRPSQHMYCLGALFAFRGVRCIWESQRPPRASALACPHCLAGDRSDTEANTCSSEDGGFGRELSARQPCHAKPTSPPKERRGTGARAVGPGSTRAGSGPADVFDYRHICGQRGSVIHCNAPCGHGGSDL